MTKKRTLNKDYFDLEGRRLVRAMPLNGGIGHSHRITSMQIRKGK